MCMHTYAHIHTHTWLCAHTHTHTWLCAHTHMHARTHEHMYTHTHTHTHTYLLKCPQSCFANVPEQPPPTSRSDLLQGSHWNQHLNNNTLKPGMKGRDRSTGLWLWVVDVTTLGACVVCSELKQLFLQAKLSMIKCGRHMEGLPLHARLCTNPNISLESNSVQTLTKVLWLSL